ncbi:regulator-eIF2 [Plasmodium vivax Mauritania I]|uniref:Regulator-eIF2 n=1 Tax=Plasmodium vivax Mauritania I TaxID=1035515 RepID=A0A0J9TE75_PLAVI|nr:regulator-eIF2 [Plasmodium vivax Mauritania I]
MDTAQEGMQGDKGGIPPRGDVDEAVEATETAEATEAAKEEGTADDCPCVTHPLGDDTVLLSSFLYDYLMNNFERIHLILNSRKVKDSLVGHVKEKAQKLKMRLEDCEHGRRVLGRDETLQMVREIHLDGLLLLSTDEADVEFSHNLVKVAVDLHPDRGVATVTSNECTLISRKWDYNLGGVVAGGGQPNGVATSKEEAPSKEAATRTPPAARQNQLKVVLRGNEANAANAANEANAATLANGVLRSIKLHSISGETTLEEKKKKSFSPNFRECCCAPSANDVERGIRQMNAFLFSLFEPHFYNSSLKKSNAIRYKELYEMYHSVMIKSRSIKLNDEVVRYLLLDSVFLPSYVKRNRLRAVQEEDNEYSSFDSYSDASSGGEAEEAEEAVEAAATADEATHSEVKSAHVSTNNGIEEATQLRCPQDDPTSHPTHNRFHDETSEKRQRKSLFQSEQFRSQLEEIQQAIEELNGSVFLRVNYKNLKKGSFVNSFSLEVNTLYDALLMLKSSTDVYKTLKENQTSSENNHLILSKYVHLNLCFLFDVYVYRNSVVAVSQKCLNYFFPFLSKPDVIEDVIRTISTFFKKHIRDTFPQDHYILQLYIHTFRKTNKKKVLLINAKSWLFKNKHPVFTNKFLTNYLFTEGGEAPGEEDTHRGRLTDGGRLTVHMTTTTKEEEKGNQAGAAKEEAQSDLYVCDGVLYYCITKDEAIYKKNANLYPKDLSYVKEGEIDMDSLLQTIKMQNEGAPPEGSAAG